MTHTVEQPGLHAHSWNPEDDLMKQYVVQRSLGEGKGWLAVSSFWEFNGAYDDAFTREANSVYFDEEADYWKFTEHRVEDQFNSIIHRFQQWHHPPIPRRSRGSH